MTDNPLRPMTTEQVFRELVKWYWGNHAELTAHPDYQRVMGGLRLPPEPKG